jgi:hypothetical protein
MRRKFQLETSINGSVTWGRGARWRSWLSHCATSRKVAGSIPDGVIGIFHFRPHCGLGVDSSSNRNEYQKYILGGKGGRCVPPLCAACLEIWERQSPGTLRACPGTALPLPLPCNFGHLNVHVKTIRSGTLKTSMFRRERNPCDSG